MKETKFDLDLKKSEFPSSAEDTAGSAKKIGGIRVGHLNIILIAAGLVVALLMVLSMFQTSDSFSQIVDVTDDYLTTQSTAGMLSDMSGRLAEQAMAFVQGGPPDLTHAWNGQYSTIVVQLDSYEKEVNNTMEDEFLGNAIRAFRANSAAELKAMRLAADPLPMWPDAFPETLRNTELTEEEAALSPEEKKAAAMALLTSEAFLANQEIIPQAVDSSHRISSEKGQIRAKQTAERVRSIIRRQTVLILLFVAMAFFALLFNRSLIISPIQRSVDNLDRREQIPERGSYEVRHLARVYNDILKDNEQKRQALSYTATHDALTGLYNRAAFDKAYKMYENDTVGVMVADIDHFKSYNDNYGHDVGDRVLRAVAEKLQEYFRSDDHISRIGGDEFCIIMPNTRHSQADKLSEKIRGINKDLANPEGGMPSVTISAGFAFWDRPNPESTLFKDADKMLLEIKRDRSDCVAVYPG